MFSTIKLFNKIINLLRPIVMSDDEISKVMSFLEWSPRVGTKNPCLCLVYIKELAVSFRSSSKLRRKVVSSFIIFSFFLSFGTLERKKGSFNFFQ